jgi:hypothetical protein
MATWQPIETLPRGETVLLTILDERGEPYWVNAGRRARLGLFYTINGAAIPHPTHWASMPRKSEGEKCAGCGAIIEASAIFVRCNRNPCPMASTGSSIAEAVLGVTSVDGELTNLEPKP